MKKYLFLVAFLMYAANVYAVVDTTQQWLPLQQIAINAQSTTSVDENYNGIIDNAEKLQGKTPSDFIGTQGGTLQGILYLYYGIGKIVDLDNTQYYIDPSSNSYFKALCLGGECITTWDTVKTSIDETQLNNTIETIVNNSVEDIKRALNQIESNCINNNCSQGINAKTLQGKTIGSDNDQIPIIDQNYIYRLLKVGYALNANSSYYVGPIAYTEIADAINKIKALEMENNYSYVSLLSLINTINSTLSLAIENLDSTIQQNKNHIIELNNTKLDQKQTQQLIKDTFPTHLEENSDTITNLVEQANIFLTKPTICGDKSYLIYENGELNCKSSYEVKTEVLANNYCSDGVLKGFDSNGEIKCVSYYELQSEVLDLNYRVLADNLINLGALDDKLKLAGFATKEDIDRRIESLEEIYATKAWTDTRLTAYLAKPNCEGILKFEDGSLKCIDSTAISFGDIEYPLQLTELPVDFATDLRCPSGYVMVGIRAEVDKSGLTDKVDDVKLAPICQEISFELE